MARSNLGENIAKYRKEAGINQEELGKAAGVSAQAVSRWECGGTPDVELLPAIADRLHVSIDALFGRDGTEAADLHRLLSNAIQQTPKARRMEAICNYIWTMQMADAVSEGTRSHDLLDILHSLQKTDRRSAAAPAHQCWEVAIDHDRGISLYGLVEDMPFALVLPEPERGFASTLKKPEEYVRLFQLLSKPRYLDMLLELHCARLYGNITDRLAASRLGLSLEEARAILDDLHTHCMVYRTAVEDADSTIYIYRITQPTFLPVFLFFCRQMMASAEDANYQVSMRNNPVFSAPPGTGSVEPDWITLDRSPEDSIQFPWKL